jgi:hypothetical protein
MDVPDVEVVGVEIVDEDEDEDEDDEHVESDDASDTGKAEGETGA